MAVKKKNSPENYRRRIENLFYFQPGAVTSTIHKLQFHEVKKNPRHQTDLIRCFNKNSPHYFLNICSGL